MSSKGGIIAGAQSFILLFILISIGFVAETYLTLDDDTGACTPVRPQLIQLPPINCNADCSEFADKANSALDILRTILGQVSAAPMSTTPQGAFDGEAINALVSENLGRIDDLQAVLCDLTAATGAVATIFDYAPPTSGSFDTDFGSFYRRITTVPNAAGALQVCTPLDDTGLAFYGLKNGGFYSGPADLFGTTYSTIYAAIQDPMTQALIGAFFVGVPY